MSKVNTPPPHEVRYERDVMELPSSDGWRNRMPTANARASCSCGQLDTGWVGAGTAYRAAQDHVKRYLPGVDWGPDIDGPGAGVAVDPDPCSDGSGRLYPFPRQHPHCKGTCVRCGQTVDPARHPVADGHDEKRCPPVPEEFRKATP